MNEPDVVRHYVNLSQLNYAVDTGFYPLGSCTMKFNPKLNEWAARLPGFANLHPLAPDEVAQGTLQLLWELERALAEISGMRAVTLQPAAGAQGELTGILMIRAYHRARGDTERDEVLVPDSSHGTNPATATMAGYRTITIPSAADGGVDVDAFRAALGPRTAAVMITNPSTLGLFETRIGELLDAVHEAGALAYMDGANLNAILGPVQAGRGRLRRHALQRPQDVLDAARRRRSGRRAGRGRGDAACRTCPSPRVLRDDDGTFRLERDGRAADLDRAPAQLRRQHRRPRARVRVHPRPRRDRACARSATTRSSPPTTCKHRLAEDVRHPVRPRLQARVRGLGRDDQEADRRPDARHRQAAHRLRLPPADDLLPADRRRGRC